MKLILEVSKEDISPVFKDVKLDPKHIEGFHFDGWIRARWKEFNEVWWIESDNKKIKIK